MKTLGSTIEYAGLTAPEVRLSKNCRKHNHAACRGVVQIPGPQLPGARVACGCNCHKHA